MKELFTCTAVQAAAAALDREGKGLATQSPSTCHLHILPFTKRVATITPLTDKMVCAETDGQLTPWNLQHAHGINPLLDVWNGSSAFAVCATYLSTQKSGFETCVSFLGVCVRDT